MPTINIDFYKINTNIQTSFGPPRKSTVHYLINTPQQQPFFKGLTTGPSKVLFNLNSMVGLANIGYIMVPKKTASIKILIYFSLKYILFHKRANF